MHACIYVYMTICCQSTHEVPQGELGEFRVDHRRSGISIGASCKLLTTEGNMNAKYVHLVSSEEQIANDKTEEVVNRRLCDRQRMNYRSAIELSALESM